MSKNFDNATQAILDALKREPMTVGELEEATGLKESHIRQILGFMVANNGERLIVTRDQGLNVYEVDE